MATNSNAGINRSQATSLPPLELGDLSVNLPSQIEATNGPGAAAPTTGTEAAITSSSPDSNRHTQNMTDGATNTVTRDTEAADTVPLTTPTFSRQQTSAIGPPTDLPTPMLEAAPSALAAGPVIQFTLLLASTGTRHPFQLNEKYLNKRNIKASGSDGEFDPGSISVYTLKELILKDWREDWDAKPSSPSAIRLIFFGQLLSDNVSLKDCKLQVNGVPNVLHITVKPQEALDDEEAGKGGKTSLSRDRDGRTSGGCRCVIL